MKAERQATVVWLAKPLARPPLLISWELELNLWKGTRKHEMDELYFVMVRS